MNENSTLVYVSSPEGSGAPVDESQTVSTPLWEVHGEMVRAGNGLHSDCVDCGGELTQAFPQSVYYMRCRRCGHVFDMLDGMGD